MAAGAARPACVPVARSLGCGAAGRSRWRPGEIAFADLLDEPFVALPASAGVLRDFWLAVDARGERAGDRAVARPPTRPSRRSPRDSEWC